MDDGTIDRALLFDFYGELLTDRQKQYIDLHWNEDWSLAEIAEKYGLTRQGVWDILRRAEATMRGLEEKTGLVRRYLERRTEIEGIRRQLTELLPDNEASRDILARLEGLN
jgi:Uncharacterized protein conserved in bacteria